LVRDFFVLSDSPVIMFLCNIDAYVINESKFEDVHLISMVGGLIILSRVALLDSLTGFNGVK